MTNVNFWELFYFHEIMDLKLTLIFRCQPQNRKAWQQPKNDRPRKE